MFDIIIDGEPCSLDLSAKSKELLQKQVIDDEQPGTILRDFETLLKFIGEDGLKTTGKNYFLPQGKLAELNDLMCRPALHRLKRPQQRSFPHLHGLYLILRASGLGVSVGASSKGRLMVNEQILDAWSGLNATERYFTLLENWLIFGSPGILGESCSVLNENFYSLSCMKQKLELRKTLLDDNRGLLLYGTMELMVVALMESFGWINIEHAEPKDGDGVKFKSIERLDFGDAMLEMLISFHRARLLSFIRKERPVEPGVLLPVFQPYFPQWQQLLTLPETPFREGTYTWRVALGQVWRRIVASAESSLDDLANAILDAFEFDNDHLYCFELRDGQGRNMRISCPYESDAEEFTDEVSLGDLPLPEGAAMIFVFDYGDEWRFEVKLEKVGAIDPELKHAKVTAKTGKAPPQYDYGDWEGEDDEDE